VRSDTLLVHCVLTLAVAGLGLFARSIHNSTGRERWISWLTWVLCVGAFAAGGLVMALFCWPPAKEYLAVAFAGGGFGFCCGLWGRRFVWKHYRKEMEAEDAD
jgi:hypothetical protein